MTERWQENRPFVVALVAWVGGAMLFLVAVHLPFSGAVAALRADEARRSELARHYASVGGRPAAGRPFDEVKRAADAEQAALDRALKSARQRIEFVPGLRFAIAPDVPERANKYMIVVRKVASDLAQEANKRGVRIPASLDPRPDGKDLPGEGDVDELLFRLAMTDRVLRAAFAAGVPRVAAVVHRLGAPRGVPLAQRTVEVELVGKLDQVVAFLGKCSAPPQADGGGILAVRGARIARAGDGTVRAVVELAAIRFIEVRPNPVVRRPVGRPRRRYRSF